MSASTGNQALIARLTALKTQINSPSGPGRPVDKPYGRWLGDFLTESTPHGLLRVELDLLAACANGYACVPAIAVPPLPPPQPPAKPPNRTASRAKKAALLRAVRRNRVRAGFLRFLVLQGDSNAPVHEAGIQLYNAYIDCRDSVLPNSIDLRQCNCAGRLALVNCFIDGKLTIEDGSLGLLYLRGSWLAGLDAQRAKVAATVFLDHDFVSTAPVNFQGAEIGGMFQCSGAIFRRLDDKPKKPARQDAQQEQRAAQHKQKEIARQTKMLELNRAKIPGSVMINANTENGASDIFTCDGAVSLVAAQIGGDLNINSAKIDGALNSEQAKIGGQMRASHAAIARGVSLSGADIAGTVYFWAARIRATAAGNNAPVAITAQNVKVRGSIYFGGGFRAGGAVDLGGAEISKDLDFSGGVFYNASDCAILADRSKIAGSVNFQSAGGFAFAAFGTVSLRGAQCSELACAGGLFKNPNADRDPSVTALDCAAINIAGSAEFRSQDGRNCEVLGAVSFNAAKIGRNLELHGGSFRNQNGAALDCSTIDIAGSAALGNDNAKHCELFGAVSFNTSQIGQHLDLRGAYFHNPDRVALDCQAAKITGCAFLGLNTDDPTPLPFIANGKVTMVGANVGLQINCRSGQFTNTSKSSLNAAHAGAALDLSAATVGDTIFLGAAKPTTGAKGVTVYPPVIRGSLNLSGATARVLIDDGLINNAEDNDQKRGLWRHVTGTDGVVRLCVLRLDLFNYQRVSGDDSCKSDLRRAWLLRQAPEDLQASFKPQPFEQLITVMRALGYNSAADDIGELKRRLERKAESQRNRAEIRAYFTHAADTHSPKPRPGAILGALWNVVVNALECVFIDWFIGYGYRMGRAVLLLFAACLISTVIDSMAFQHGDIVPADKDIRTNKFAASCLNWSPSGCPVIADEVIPPFHPFIYSADVIIPVIALGQKTAWTPSNAARWLYWLQFVETIFGWVGASLLAAFITGLISKE